MWKKILEKLGLIVVLKRPDFIIDIKNGTGFKDVEPTPEDYILGSDNSALKVILSEERDYSKYLPTNELQKRDGFDSYSCVVFSGLNNLEIIHRKNFGFEVNYSDRFIAGMIPVVPNAGTNYSAFWDTVRKRGLVLEEDYPWGGKNGQEYVKRPPQEIIDKAQIFLDNFEIQHEWVGYAGCDNEKLYEALRYGPLQASVDAGATYNGKYSKATNHSITIYGAVKGKKWLILDHYSRSTYELPWKFYFGSAKQATLIKKKRIQLVQMPFKQPQEEASKIYAVFGNVACHIANEYTWNYGAKLGIWPKETITLLTEASFNSKFTVGEQISFK